MHCRNAAMLTNADKMSHSLVMTNYKFGVLVGLL